MFFSIKKGVFTSIHREGFISLEQVGYEGADQRCYVEDVEFLYRFSSSLLWNAEPNLSTSRGLHRESICFQT